MSGDRLPIDVDRGPRLARRGPAAGGAGPIIGLAVTVLLLLTVAAVLIVPLFSATRTLAERRGVDRMMAVAALPALVERIAAEARLAVRPAARTADEIDEVDGAEETSDPEGTPIAAEPRSWRSNATRARRIAARLAGVEGAEGADASPGSGDGDGPGRDTPGDPLPPAIVPLEDVPGGTDAAFAVLATLDDLSAAAEAAMANRVVDDVDEGGRRGAPRMAADVEAADAAIRAARNEAVIAAERLVELLRRDIARGFARRLRFDGGVLAVVVLLGLLQVALLVRMRRLNAGLHVEIERRIDSERRVREREAELWRAADELRVARDDAEAADRAKSRFLATMSHEFRTPLNGILGFTWLVERGLSSSPPAALLTDVRRIRSAGEHMLRLVSDVLDLAKIEAGMMDLDVAPFDADALVREIAASAESICIAGGNTFELDAAPLGEARTDATRLRQVADNLLSNASRFTDAGHVRLVARRLDTGVPLPADIAAPAPAAAAADGDQDLDPDLHVDLDGDESPTADAHPDADAGRDPHPDVDTSWRTVGTIPGDDVDRLMLSVADTGRGMSRQELAAAFDEFVQVDDSAARRHGGTGLGLALVVRFAELLGGGVIVGTRPGAGTRCTLVVPARRQPAPRTPTAGAAAAGDAGDSRDLPPAARPSTEDHAP